MKLIRNIMSLKCNPPLHFLLAVSDTSDEILFSTRSLKNIELV